VKAPRPTRPTLRILAKGKCTTGRIWSYVRDDRPFAGPAPPAAVYYASGDRRGEHPQKHLAGFSGILQADCYNGFEPLFDPRMRASPITPAFCFAHARRGFFELADIEKKAREGEKGKPISPIALEAVLRLDALFEIERAINGRNPEERRTVRQEKSKPLFDDMHAWLLRERETLSRSAEVLKPINYMLKRWADFARFLDDGRICLSNNAAERSLRGVATGLSLCTSFSSIWKHWELVFVIDATRATCSRDRGDNLLVPQVGSPDLVRSVGHNLVRAEDAVLDEPAYAIVRDAEGRSGFRHREPLAVLLGGAVGVDAVHPPQRADTVGRPSLPLARRNSHSVQRGGDVLVRPTGRHAPHHGEGLFRRAAAVLPGLRLAHPQLRVLTASPMDRQDDLAHCIVDVGDDVGDKGAEQALACAHGHAGRIPCRVEIVRQPREVGRSGGRVRRPRLYSRQARLDAA